MSNFQSGFHVFRVKTFNIFFENTVAFALKSCIIKIKKNWKCFEFFEFFFLNKTFFLGLRTFSNVNVLHKSLLLQD